MEGKTRAASLKTKAYSRLTERLRKLLGLEGECVAHRAAPLAEEVGGNQFRPFRTLPLPLITLGRFAEEPPQTVYRGVPVDHDDEDLTQVAFRTMDLTDAMP